MSDSHRDSGFKMQDISVVSDQSESRSCQEPARNLTDRANTEK